MMLASTAPNTAGIALVVGMGVTTYGAVLATIGYFANRFLRQQTSNHKDTLTALALLRQIKRTVVKLDRRVVKLEEIHEPLAHRHWHARR